MKAMTTKRLIRISYFTMLTIIGGLIQIPVPPVSFTFQTLFVILSGFVLGKHDGAFSQIAYMLIGLVGLPVFTKGGGFAYVLQPSFGYIFSFFIGSFIAGMTLKSFRTLSTFKIFLSGIVGLLPIYIIGMTYQVVILVLVNGLTFAAACISLINLIYMFLGDAVMLFIISIIYPKLLTMQKINQGIAGKKENETAAISPQVGKTMDKGRK